MKKIKILFDYSPAYKPNKTGIPMFVSELFTTLKDIEEINIEKTFDISQIIPRKPHKIFRFFEQLLYHNIYLPLKLYFGNYDFYVENQYMFIPLFKPKNTQIINMVFDIGLVLFDTIHTKKHIDNWRNKFPKSLNNTDIIITLSESSQKDILQYMHNTKQIPKPIDYIYADAKPIYLQKNECDRVLNKFNISNDYFLFLGTLEPRKNPLNLLKAFNLFKQNTHSNIKLVFAGKKGWQYQDVLTYIDKEALQNEVLFTGYISDHEKYALLQKAKAFLFLSLYEGFGIPVLEALKLGTPTLVSDIPVFHELFEDNVLYASTNDMEDIADKMSQVYIHPITIDTTLLEKFSWEMSANKFITILTKHFNTKTKKFN